MQRQGLQLAEVKRKFVSAVLKKRTVLPGLGMEVTTGRRINRKVGRRASPTGEGRTPALTTPQLSFLLLGYGLNYPHPPGESLQISKRPLLVQFLN